MPNATFKPLDTERFDYGATADLFTAQRRRLPSRPGGSSDDAKGHVRSAFRNGMTYRRFAGAAEAIAFAIERLSADDLATTVLEIDGERYAVAAIRALYDSANFPLSRQGHPQAAGSVE
jgi:hypothetical protein